MKKKNIQIFISLFWGINFLFLLVYALFSGIIDLFRGKKEKLVDDLDYDTQFRTLILVPLLTLIVYILLIFLTDYGFLVIWPWILTVYEICLIICVAVILLTPGSLRSFDKEATNILATYKQFGIFIVLDTAVVFGQVLFWEVNYNGIAFVLINSVSFFVLMIFLVKFWRVKKQGRENIQELGKMQEKLGFQSKSYTRLLQNILDIQELTPVLLSENKTEDAIECLNNIFGKSAELITLAKKGKKYQQLSEANIVRRKIEKQLYESKTKQYMLNFEAKYESLKKAKNFDDPVEYNQIRDEMDTLLKNVLLEAKEINHRKEMTKLTAKLQQFRKEYPERK